MADNKKENMKCVRISNEVLAIVEAYEGTGFNQKFENLVIEFKKTLPEREAYKKRLDETIQECHNKIKKLRKDIDKGEQLQRYLDNYLNYLKDITK